MSKINKDGFLITFIYFEDEAKIIQFILHVI